MAEQLDRPHRAMLLSSAEGWRTHVLPADLHMRPFLLVTCTPIELRKWETKYGFQEKSTFLPPFFRCHFAVYVHSGKSRGYAGGLVCALLSRFCVWL